MKIIFLDIDGVLNCENAYMRKECKYITWGDEDKHEYHQQFGIQQKKWLNKLIVESGAKVVLSSTWRQSGFERMKKIWKIEEMEGELIDTTCKMVGDKKNIVFFNDRHKKQPTPKTKNYTIPRGVEIKYWLSDMNFSHIFWSKERQLEYMEKSGIENYIIIDDDSDMLYTQKEHFVHVLPSPRNKEGLTEQFYKQGLEILNKDLIDMYYGEKN